MRIVFIDTETTGLVPYGRLDDEGKPGNAEIIEYTLQVWADDVRAPDQTMRLTPRFGCDPGAAKVNGYDPATWGGIRTWDWHDSSNLNLLDGSLVGGHNVEFDLGMVRGEFLRAGIKPPRWNYRTIDTQKIFAPLVAMGICKSAGLGDLCDHFGLSREGAHSSLGDVRMTIDLWEKACDLFLRAYGL